MTLGTPPRVATEMVEFLIIDMPRAYNGIIGRPSQVQFEAIASAKHQVMKFPTRKGIGEVWSNQRTSRSCYLTSLKNKSIAESLPVDFLDVREELHPKRGKPVEGVTRIPLEESEERYLQIGATLEEPTRGNLLKLLRNNLDVFAWSSADMPGISPTVAAHKLSVLPGFKPVRQKKRSLGEDRRRAAEEEVDKLLEAEFIEEITYPEWLANVVMVKKSNGSWRMCVDFTDLNKARPQGLFPSATHRSLGGQRVRLSNA